MGDAARRVSTMSSPLVAEIRRAVRAQDWDQVLTRAPARHYLLLSVEDSLEIQIAEADALRSSGELLAARDLYVEIDAGLERREARRASVLHGLADCYLAAGDEATALRLGLAAEEIRESDDRHFALRLGTLQGRALARCDLPRALEAYQSVLGAGDLPSGSARANLRYWYAEALMTAGEFARARQQLAIAHSDAEAQDAAKTVADALSREATLPILEGEQAGIAAALERLGHAESLYLGLGDRSRDGVFTLRGQVLAQLGNLRGAEAEYRRGLWLSSRRRDALQAAHNLLGLADTLRVEGRPFAAPLASARGVYERRGLVWGSYYCDLIIAAAGERAALERASALASEMPEALGAHDLLALIDLGSYAGAPLRLLFPR